MVAADSSHVLLELVEIRVRAENGTRRRIERLKKPVTEANSRLGMIAGGKKRGTSDISQGSLRNEM